MLKEIGKGIQKAKCGVTQKYPSSAPMTIWHTDVDCVECLVAMGKMVTKTGKVLTNDDIQALADEAERGYDVSKIRTKRVIPRQ
jgi:hypothetical protein